MTKPIKDDHFKICDYIPDDHVLAKERYNQKKLSGELDSAIKLALDIVKNLRDWNQNHCTHHWYITNVDIDDYACDILRHLKVLQSLANILGICVEVADLRDLSKRKPIKQTRRQTNKKYQERKNAKNISRAKKKPNKSNRPKRKLKKHIGYLNQTRAVDCLMSFIGGFLLCGIIWILSKGL